MAEPNLIQQQRDILRAFRQAAAQRAKAEADAEARRRTDRVTADAALNELRQKASTQLGTAREYSEQARQNLAQVGMQHLTNQTTAELPAPSPSDNPSQVLFRESYYRQAVAALEVKQWDSAAAAVFQLNKLESTYKDISNLASDHQELRQALAVRYGEIWLKGAVTLLNTLSSHTDPVRSVTFSLDSRILASASWDKTVKLWDVASGRELRTLNGHTNGVQSVTFAPDGKTLASASEDSAVKLWDVASGQELRTLNGHRSSVWSVAFSQDGKILASGSADATVKLWEAK